MSAPLLALLWSFTVMALAPAGRRWSCQLFNRLERWLRLQLESFHLFLSPRSVRSSLLILIGASVGLSLVFTPSLWLVPLGILLAMALIVVLVRQRLSARRKLLRSQLPGLVELLATSLRAGLSIRSALGEVARQAPVPMSQELAVVERTQRIGLTVNEALSAWGKRTPIAELELLSFAVGVSVVSGGNLAGTLDQLADTFRQRLALEEKIDALTAQGRLQAKVMIALPILLAVSLTALDPSTMSVLWMTTTGHFLLFGIGVLEVIGFLWIKRLTRIDF